MVKNSIRTNLRFTYHTVKAFCYMLMARVLARLGTRRCGGNDRHLLLICSYFPPFMTGGTYRPMSFVRHAQAGGWKVTVVTQSPAIPRNDAERELLQRIVDLDATIIRLPSLWLVPSPRLFPTIDGDLPAVYYYFLWLLRRLKTPFSVVMASGPQFDNFELARLLARWSRTPLVLEYRDEWSDSPFPFVRLGTADRRYEARALKNADVAVFTTQSQLRKNSQSFPEGPQRTIIPNGWDENLNSAVSPPPTLRTKRIIRYVGNFGPHICPADFLTLVAQALALHPQLRGQFEIRINDQRPKVDLETEDIADTVFWDGKIAQSEVAGVLADSDGLLILYPPSMEKYIPGKFYEYVASGTPILVTSETGEVPDIVRELSAGILMQGATPQSFVKALEQLLAASRDDFNSPKRQAWAQAHTRLVAARQLYEMLDSLIEREYGRTAIKTPQAGSP